MYTASYLATINAIKRIQVFVNNFDFILFDYHQIISFIIDIEYLIVCVKGFYQIMLISILLIYVLLLLIFVHFFILLRIIFLFH